MFILVIMLGVKLKHDLVAIAGEINLLIKLYIAITFESNCSMKSLGVPSNRVTSGGFVSAS